MVILVIFQFVMWNNYWYSGIIGLYIRDLMEYLLTVSMDWFEELQESPMIFMGKSMVSTVPSGNLT